MPPKKATDTQVHLLVIQNTQGHFVEILAGFTTADAAEAAIEEYEEDHEGIEVFAVDLRKPAPKKAVKAATKEVATRAKPKAKKAKDADVDEDEDDEEQAAVNAKKAAGDNKRKHVIEGKEGSLNGLNMLFTGTFVMDRKTCEATAIKHGATIVTSLKKADLIVLGLKPGPKKVQEINEEGYKTTDEDGFHAMVQGNDKKKKTS